MTDHWNANIDNGLQDKDAALIGRALKWNPPESTINKINELIAERLRKDAKDSTIDRFGNLLCRMKEHDLKVDEFEDKTKRLDNDEATENQSFTVVINPPKEREVTDESD